MNRRHPLVVAVQGPAKPWWLAPLLTIAGLVLGFMSIGFWPNPFGIAGACAGISMLVVGAVWWRTRSAEWQFYKRIAEQHDWSTCPICDYDLSGADPSRCPECGRDVDALRRKLEARRHDLF